MYGGRRVIGGWRRGFIKGGVTFYGRRVFLMFPTYCNHLQKLFIAVQAILLVLQETPSAQLVVPLHATDATHPLPDADNGEGKNKNAENSEEEVRFVEGRK